MSKALRAFLALAITASALAEEKPSSPTASLIPWLLDEQAELKEIPFSEIIFQTTGHKIIPLEAANETDQRVLKQIGGALDEVIKRMSAPDSPVQSFARINEVSSAFENMIRELLDAVPGLHCEFPRTAQEKVQRSGYPDLRLTETASGRVYYLDPKLFAAGARTSSFRTFYFEPKGATNKVREDAVHLILGFEHTPRKAGHWDFTRWDVVDLARFKVRLKAEFQGSNRDLYRPDAIVATSGK